MKTTPALRLGYWEHLRAIMVRAGIINIDGPIQGGLASAFMGEIMLARQTAQEFTVYINSPGGDVSEACAFHDLIRAVAADGIPVKVVAMGITASAACMIILQAGDERLSFPNTRFFLHELHQTRHGPQTTTESQEQAKEMKRLQERMLAVLSKRTGRAVKELQRAIGKKELWLSPEEALEWGLIDGIISGLPKV